MNETKGGSQKKKINKIDKSLASLPKDNKRKD